MPRLLRPAAILIALALPFGSAQDADSTRAAPGTLLDVVAEGTTGPYEIQRLAAPMFGRHGPPIIENEVASYRIRYVTTGLDGEPAEIVAQLLVPVLPRGAAGGR
jgi:hypothetical protein